MAAGSVQYIVECVPTSTGATFSACPPVGGVSYGMRVVQAYVVDPSSASLIDSLSSSGGLPPAEDVASVFSVGFSLVILCFLVGRAVGALLELVRKG